MCVKGGNCVLISAKTLGFVITKTAKTKWILFNIVPHRQGWFLTFQKGGWRVNIKKEVGIGMLILK